MKENKETTSGGIKFSKVELWSDDGVEFEFLVSGAPDDQCDIEYDPEYDHFMMTHTEFAELEANITTYLYKNGDSEIDDATCGQLDEFSKLSEFGSDFEIFETNEFTVYNEYHKNSEKMEIE